MTRQIISRRAYLILIVLLAASLPLSIFASSAIQVLLFINWCVEGDFKLKWNRIRTNKAFWIYSSLFLLHIIGMLWSEDLLYGLKDLKIKLPLILIPVIIVSSNPLSSKELKIVLEVFLLGLIISSLASLLALSGFILIDTSDYRNISLFVSHIRFSLMIVLGIAIAFFYLFSSKIPNNKYERILFFVSLIWLPVFLIILRSLSGIVILLMIFLIVSFLRVRKIQDRAGRFMLSVFIIFIPLFVLIYISSAINRFYSFDDFPENPDDLTIEGNEYLHYPDRKETENGHYVWLYVCPDEIEREWSKISQIPYYGKAENGDLLRFTLIRYLTSKGLRKDALGISNLTKEDVQAIEQGKANHIYLDKFALYPRIYEVIWEFDRYRLGANPNDKSLVQRFFYLKAGVQIAADHPWIGVGTGDVRSSFGEYYETINSPLRTERRRRAHNQYLTFAVAFGFIGAVLAILAIFMPMFVNRRWSSFLALVFLAIMCLSMLNEDTLENTPGVVMFGLFYALFILMKEEVEKKENYK